eukprot:CAMPEP_0173393120 /NCGR_PEP_ID=MMETSP1356-20130122/21928_1 /TAXON_ID=77927 ORGANISM="Hemiselmis virescens, Strain PCC157" /NCGR_SAMPLE_ID=MMETSP1356 /ASSEMBLY_ACC=CAM_ASM_000847 /LENGTH=76 /DNA_ID=CAMNT_0014351093 /DNA_START=25 /DNA_END=255 /DNA_ORIENTATION=-
MVFSLLRQLHDNVFTMLARHSQGFIPVEDITAWPCPVNTTVPNNGCDFQGADDVALGVNGNAEGFVTWYPKYPRTD